MPDSFKKKVLSAISSTKNILEFLTIVTSSITNYFFSAGDGTMRAATAALTTSGVVILAGTCVYQVRSKYKQLQSYVTSNTLLIHSNAIKRIKFNLFISMGTGMGIGLASLIGYNLCIYFVAPKAANVSVALITMFAVPIFKKMATMILRHAIDGHIKRLESQPLEIIVNRIEAVPHEERTNIPSSVLIKTYDSQWMRLRIVGEQMDQESSKTHELQQQHLKLLDKIGLIDFSQKQKRRQVRQQIGEIARRYQTLKQQHLSLPYKIDQICNPEQTMEQIRGIAIEFQKLPQQQLDVKIASICFDLKKAMQQIKIMKTECQELQPQEFISKCGRLNDYLRQTKNKIENSGRECDSLKQEDLVGIEQRAKQIEELVTTLSRGYATENSLMFSLVVHE